MANDEIIIDNFIIKIQILKQKPQKNKPFTKFKLMILKNIY
jgi:hypothetical protein